MPRTKIFLVGAINNQIAGSKLPSKRNCLSVLFYNMRVVKMNLNDSAALVIDECLVFWKKARIPTQDRLNCIKKLKKLYEGLRSIEKSKSRNSDLQKKKENDFGEALDELFDIAHANAMNLIKIEEDKQFLSLQREKGRVGCMVGTDKKLFLKEKRRQDRTEKEQVRREKGDLGHESISPADSNESLPESDLQIEETNVERLETPHTSTAKRARREILSGRLCAALDKCRISDRDAVHIITACVDALELNVNDFVINRSSIKRTREEFRKQAAMEVHAEFISADIDFVVIHWDSKILPDLCGKDTVDRLPVIATSQNIEQLLGVPKLSSGKGKEVALAVHETLQQWSLESKTQAFVFDTTASNSGRLNGACVLLEQLLDRDILFLACRHHIYEIMLASAFHEANLLTQSGPDIPIFKRFQKNWKNINKDEYSIWHSDDDVCRVLNDVRQDVLSFANKKILDDFPRDDYKEFLELIIITLGGTPPSGIRFKYPGAYHLARWMAKAIYCLKIFLFRKQFQLNEKEEVAIKDICCFIIKCYTEAWFCSTNAIQAPLNDFTFMKRLESYKNDNPTIAEKCQKKFLNHLWYLNEECAVMSIFDTRIDDHKRRKIASILLQEEQDEEIHVDIQKKKILSYEELSSFLKTDFPENVITSRSKMLLKRFNISTDFLHQDPSLWETNENFIKGREVLASLKVVNDVAERGVKLMEEFNSKLTKNEDQKQYLLKVVKEYRKKYPGHSKSVLSKFTNAG